MNPAQRSLNRWWAIAFETRPTPDGDTDRREPVLTR